MKKKGPGGNRIGVRARGSIAIAYHPQVVSATQAAQLVWYSHPAAEIGNGGRGQRRVVIVSGSVVG